MKKLSFLAMAAFGLLFAACSSDKDVAEQSQSGIMDGKAQGYFKINLNLPTAPVVSTRGWEEKTSGTLDDGLAKEYGVKTCVLLLFEGTTEADAKLFQVSDISGSFSAVTDNPNQITSNYTKTVKLEIVPSGKIYALAVINGKNNIEYLSPTSIKLRGESKTTADNITIATLQAATATSNSVSANDFIFTEGSTDYYFMTNAVLSDEKGGTVEPATAAGNMHILATVDKSFIYDSESEADSGTPATDIYVERGMAKVTIASASLATNGLTDNTSKLATTATLDGWCLDITNKSSYVVRQVPTESIWNLTSKGSASVDKYRFIGANAVDAFYGTAAAGYRTYWALDPNYDGPALSAFTDNKNASAFSYATYSTDKKAAIGEANPQYCFENTFDVAHQDARYTTRAIIGVKLTSDGSDFYVMGADRKTLYTLADVENKVATSLMNSGAFSNWYAAQGNGTLSGTDLTITWDKTTAGKIEVVSVNIPAANIKTGSAKYDAAGFTINASTTAFTDNSVDYDFTGLITTLNGMLTNVERFEHGIAYYAIRIKHFGDDLTPWKNGEFDTGSEPAEATPKAAGESDANYATRMINAIYPDATDGRQNANYLGRYGMVRNNWYELVIGDIQKIGYSEPPTIPSHPDDELEESYISARINILSWAKRTQSWNLK